MSNLNLYNIEREYLEIANQLIEAGGEVTPELEQALAINKENLQVKSAKYAYVTKSLNDEVDLIDKEIERLTELKNKRIKGIEVLKDRVKTAMDLYGIKKIESNNIKLMLVRTKPVVVIENENDIPKKFKPKKTVITYPVDKKAIKEAIDAGLKVKGAVLKENETLQIK